jgi:hypothetical protein
MWLADKLINFVNFPSLQGSREQISVAENIRSRILLDLLEEIIKRYPDDSGDKDNEYLKALELIRERAVTESNVFWDLARQDWAVWWIENRFAEAADFLTN